MDTYGDMVTLLLCFFVLLYSISSIDQTKWMLVVQSFNKEAIVSTDDTPQGPEGENNEGLGNDMPMTQDEVEVALDELYRYLQETVANDSVAVSRGTGTCSCPLTTPCSLTATATSCAPTARRFWTRSSPA